MRPFSSPARTALSHVASCTRLLPQTKALVARRTFTSLPSLRPTLLARTNTVFRSHNMSSPLPSLAPTSALPAGAEALDIVPKSAITSHPAFGGLQIRCGPRPTMATTSRLVRKRRHGFLSRIRTRTGRRLLQRRKTKGRHIMSN